jgi:hypothetical protein
VLNNQPQGGFVTRKPTADILVASDNRSDQGFFSFFNFPRDPEPQPVNPRRRGGQYYQPVQPVQRGFW